MTLSNQLQKLETNGLIRLAQEQPELQYLFRHVLVQDAAYESLLLSDRQRWHGVIAEVLEEAFAGQLDEVAAELARHFLAAGETQPALRYFRRAGDVAFAEYANMEAEQLYRQALQLTAVPADTAPRPKLSLPKPKTSPKPCKSATFITCANSGLAMAAASTSHPENRSFRTARNA